MIERIVASIIRVFWFFDKSKSISSLKPSLPPRKSSLDNYSSLGLTISEELGKKQTDKITDIPMLYSIDKLQFPWTVKALNVFIHTRDKNLHWCQRPG